VDTLTIVSLGCLVIIGVIVLVWFFSSASRVVRHEERLVIYRLGKFNRVVGPGVVRVYPKIDRVIKTIEVRDHPVSVTVAGIFAFGVPNDFTLNLWYRSDPVEAAGSDRTLLTRLVQMTEAERHNQVEVKMREALVKQVTLLQQQYPMPDYASTFDGVIALAPGSVRYTALIDGIAQRLRQTLPTIGVILLLDQPITLVGRGIPEEIIKALQQKRGLDISGPTLIQYGVQLKHTFPEMSDAVLSQILGSIPGVDMSNVRPIVMEHLRGYGANVEYELQESGRGQVNLQFDANPPRLIEAKPVDIQPASGGNELNENDLMVLKRIPRSSQSQKKSE